MAKIVIIFACVALFQVANALQCYHCDGAACEKDLDSLQKSQCSKSGDSNQESACLKHVYKDKITQKETTTKKCVLFPKGQKYQCAAVGEEVFCETCTSELCNSSSGISLSFVAIAGIFVAMLVPKFFV